MVLYYAMKFIQNSREDSDIKKMVLMIGDSGESYLTHAFSDTWMIENELLDDAVTEKLSSFYI